MKICGRDPWQGIHNSSRQHQRQGGIEQCIRRFFQSNDRQRRCADSLCQRKMLVWKSRDRQTINQNKGHYPNTTERQFREKRNNHSQRKRLCSYHLWCCIGCCSNLLFYASKQRSGRQCICTCNGAEQIYSASCIRTQSGNKRDTFDYRVYPDRI